VVALIFVDSNVWIFLNMENYPEHPMSREKINYLRTEGIATNLVVVSEVFHKLSLLLDRSRALVRLTKMLDSADVSYIPTEAHTARKAVRLSAMTRLRINDAIIAEQALAIGAGVLTDNVKDFRKVRGLKVIPLR